jgi:hypothetical protein
MSMKRPFPDSDAVILKTDALLKNNNGSISIVSHGVPTKDRFKEYSKNSGVVYENSSSIFDFENLAENLREQSAKMYEEFNNVKTNVDSAYEKSVDLSDDNINFKNVFQKFRGCLNRYREAFADEIVSVPSLTVGSTTYDLAYLKESIPATLTYVDMTNFADVKTMVEMLESIKNKVLDILKDPSAYVPASSSSSSASSSVNFSTLSYNDKDIGTIDKDNLDTWSGKEVSILEEPQNHENVLYVIGQVFNIIDPTHYDSFLTDKPSTASSLSSVSKTNFFKFIEKDPKITSISKDGTLYVGETNGNQKQGKGMMRWANGSIFEGTFANDFIANGSFNGQPLVASNPTSGAAMLDTDTGIFNMVAGEFVSTGTSSTSPTSSTSSTSSTSPVMVAVGSSTTSPVTVAVGSSSTSPVTVAVGSSSTSTSTSPVIVAVGSSSSSSTSPVIVAVGSSSTSTSTSPVIVAVGSGSP